MNNSSFFKISLSFKRPPPINTGVLIKGSKVVEMWPLERHLLGFSLICTFMLVALCQVSFVLFCNSSHCVKNVQIRPEKTWYVSMSQTFDKVPKDHKIGRKLFWFILSLAKSFYVLCFTCVWKKNAKFLYFSVVCPFLLHCFC